MMCDAKFNLVITKENAESNLYCVVINANENAELLNSVPHKVIEDLAIVPRLRVAPDASVLVTYKVCSVIDMSSEDVFRLAQKNTESKPYVCKRMGEMLGDLLFQDADCMDNDGFMYVLTNQKAIDGAVAITSPFILQSAYETIGGDFYILPSSRHEVILVKQKDYTDVQLLRNMVREVNATVLDEKEKLSDNVYRYDRATQSIRIA